MGWSESEGESGFDANACRLKRRRGVQEAAKRVGWKVAQIGGKWKVGLRDAQCIKCVCELRFERTLTSTASPAASVASVAATMAAVSSAVSTVTAAIVASASVAACWVEWHSWLG